MEPRYLLREDVRALNARRQGRETRRVCHIPEKGIYFGLRGNVYSCCYNKSYLLGRYPDQSIREIWNGKARKQLHRAIKKWDLSLGCQGCFELIKARNLNALPLRNYDRFAARNGGYPAKMDFELFNTCNLECIMCRGEFSSTIRKNRERLPAIHSPYDGTFFDQVEEFIPYLKSSHFLGGEPFLIPQYVDLWERMAHLNPKISVSVQTNGTVLNQHIKGVLERIQMHIGLSIDSVDPANYARIRKNGQWDRVLEHLHYFRQYTLDKGTLLTMAFCPMPQNWHEIPDVVEFCNTWEMPIMFTTVESPPDCSLSALPYTTLTEIEAVLSERVLAQGTPLERQNRLSYVDLVAQISTWKEIAHRRHLAGIQTRPKTFPEFIAQIHAWLLHESKANQSNTTAVLHDIESKLRHVLEFADSKGLRPEAEMKLLATQPELVVRSVPSLSKEELLSLFSSFVMPLE